MKKVTSYLTKNVLIAISMVAGTLVLVVWLTQALRFIDLVLSKGLPLKSFFILTVFLTPDLIVTLLPFSMMIGSLFTFYRLQGDSEITVFKALGTTPIQLMKGPLYASAILVVLMIFANMLILPASSRHFKDQEFSLRQSDAPLHVRPRVFQTFGNIMVYVRHVARNGSLKGILVQDKRKPGRSVTYTAENGAWIVAQNSLRLMLIDGTQQYKGKESRPPEVLQFKEYYLDFSQGQIKPRLGPRKIFELDVTDLLTDNAEDTYGPKLQREFHKRIIHPLLGFVLVCMGLGIVLLAPYNRQHRLFPMLMAGLSGAVLQIIVLILMNRAETIPWVIWVIYCLFASIIIGTFLILSPPQRQRRLTCLGA